MIISLPCFCVALDGTGLTVLFLLAIVWAFVSIARIYLE